MDPELEKKVTDIIGSIDKIGIQKIKCHLNVKFTGYDNCTVMI